MKTYARMIDGVIAQIIPAVFDDKGREVPIESRFPPEVVAQMVEYPPRPEPSAAPTQLQLWERAINETRVLRQPILLVLDGLQSSALTIVMAAVGEPEEIEQAKERAQLIETAKQGLRNITKLNLSDCTTYEEMRTKVGAAYYALAAALPPDIRLAFAEATK